MWYSPPKNEKTENLENSAETARQTPKAQSVSLWAAQTLHFFPDPLQSQVLDASTSRVILCCTRQWGKSTMAAIKALHLAAHKNDAQILLAAPTLRQSAELLAKCARFAKKLNKAQTTSESIHLANGSRILALPQNPDTIRGYSATSLLIVDEAAFVANELIDAATPSLSRSNGDLWLLSSANSQSGHFYTAWHDQAQNWQRFTATADDTPALSRDFLAEERLVKGEAIFRREYYCEFIAGPHQLFDQALIENGFIDSELSLNLQL